jgi:hypothetical protein
VRNLDEFIRADLGRLVIRQLHAPGRLPLGKDRYRIYGEHARAVDDPTLPEDSEELLVSKVAFVELNHRSWARYGTAETVVIRFDDLDTEPTVQLTFLGVSIFDRENNRSFESEREEGVVERIRRKFPLKVKWLNLNELIHCRRNPESLPEVREKLQVLRGALARERFFQSLAGDFGQLDKTGQPDCELTFSDGETEYILRAESLTPDLYDYKPTFANVELIERTEQKTRRATAQSGTIDIVTQTGADFGKAYVELFGNVLITDETDPSRPIPRNRERFTPVALPRQIRDEVTAISAHELLDASVEIGGRKGFSRKRAAAIEARGEFIRDIIGVLHSRLAFSVSVFVLVILAAALGIVFRGSHVLTAFGISFVPSLFVIVTIIMGRQLAEKEPTMAAGVAVIWSGIVLVGGLDLWILTRVLRR